MGTILYLAGLVCAIWCVLDILTQVIENPPNPIG